MQIWRWDGASNSYATLLPAHNADLLGGVFAADGTPKTWAVRPQVVPALERIAKKQLPLGDISFIMGGSVVLNGRAYAALGTFLQPFGEFLELELVDETGMGGGDQILYFYNVTRMIPCIDFAHSDTEGKKVLRPAFMPGVVPRESVIFKDPWRKKIDIYLNPAAHDELARLMTDAGLRGSTFHRMA